MNDPILNKIHFLEQRIKRLESSPLGVAVKDQDYAVALAIEMGFEASVIEKSNEPEVLTRRQQLAMRLRREKKWGWRRIAAALNCTETTVQRWNATLWGNKSADLGGKA